MNLFFDDQADEGMQEFLLNEDETRHATKVLRMKTGDELYLINGKGFLFKTIIKESNVKRCSLEIIEVKREEKSPKEVHIAIAPTKNLDRIEWFVEKATEIGITEISWILCENSERKIIKNERLKKILISATKQSKRLFIPKLNELISLKTFLDKHPQGAIAHCYEGRQQETIGKVFQSTNFPILIGPEGDFSIHELEMIEKLKYKGITLGKNRLRTETAALVACMQCVYL